MAVLHVNSVKSYTVRTSFVGGGRRGGLVGMLVVRVKGSPRSNEPTTTVNPHWFTVMDQYRRV
jgi:hypothetical protein